MSKVSLIGAASGWGAGYRHTEEGPPALRALGLGPWLRDAGIAAEWTAMIDPARFWREHPEASREEVFELVRAHNAALAAAVQAAVERRRLPVVLGGDHSIAIGTWGGVSRGLARQPFGLIWFDAHLDAHTFETSPSMNPHGMSAAVLLGHGDPSFLAIGGHAVRPEHLCYIGARSYEAGEVELLRRLGVRVVLMEEVRRRGLGDVVAEAHAIANRGTIGYGITIDLDGFEPEDAPGIGLKEPNGLRRTEMLDALAKLKRDKRLKAIEIVEYIPEFDEERRTAHLVRDLLVALLAPVGAAAKRLAAVESR
jgi:arginase